MPLGSVPDGADGDPPASYTIDDNVGSTPDHQFASLRLRTAAAQKGMPPERLDKQDNARGQPFGSLRLIASDVGTESPTTAFVPKGTRRSRMARAASPAASGLTAQRLIVVMLATDAFGGRQFVVCAPGKQPSLHVLVPNIMSGLNLTIGLANFCSHSFLVGNVGLGQHRR